MLRWLCGDSDSRRGDYDLFFPSLDALNDTATAMTRNGYEFIGYVLRPTTIGHRLAAHTLRSPSLDLSVAADCRAVFVPIAPGALRRVAAIEFRSPDADRLELATIIMRPTPHEVIDAFDLSICQFVVDGRLLYTGQFAAMDLLHGRCRVTDVVWPMHTARRLARYARRGYLPSAGSALSLACGIARLAVQTASHARTEPLGGELHGGVGAAPR